MTNNANAIMEVATETSELTRDLAARDETLDTRATVCPLCGSKTTREFLRAPDRFHLRREIYKLMRCEDCTGVWLADPPAPGEMGLHYSEDYHRAITKSGETVAQYRWQRHRDLISRYKQSGAILDIGCSSGAFLGTMKHGWKLHGIEMERATAEKARLATGAEIFVGNAMDAPFAPESFDAITCFDVLEHVYNPREFLSQVMQWLKPGGMFFAMLPNIDAWEAKIFGSYWYGLELPRHTFHFSPKSLRRVMSSLGFCEVLMNTPAASHWDASMSYLYSAGLEKLGLEATPLSRPKRAGIPERLVRKALRMTLVKAFSTTASLAGAGGGIEAVFAKPPLSKSRKAGVPKT